MDERQRPPEERSSERSTTSESADTMADVKEEAKAKARDLGRQAEEGAQRWASSVGRQAESLARALRVASDSLWVEGEERLASVVGDAADQVDRMSGYLEHEDPSGMLDDLADLGRRNPGAFLGSAFAMGLATGRFLRASSPNGRWRSREHGPEESASNVGVGAATGAYTAPGASGPMSTPMPAPPEGATARPGTERRS